MTEPDGIGEVFEETVRVAASAAATGRTIAARRREQQLAESRAAGEQQAHVARAQHATERASALAELAVVEQRDWWETAAAGEIEHAWQTAQRWRDHEPAASRASVALRAEHRRRTGVDLARRPDTAVDTDSELAEVRRLSAASFPQPASTAVQHAPSGPPRARTARPGRVLAVERERQR